MKVQRDVEKMAKSLHLIMQPAYTIVLSETRRGWPLLTVESERKGDSKSTHKRSPFLVVLLLVVPVQETFILPWLLWPARKIFFFFSKCTNEMGRSWLVRWLVMPVQRTFILPWLL
jgi:hypothetical protein